MRLTMVVPGIMVGLGVAAAPAYAVLATNTIDRIATLSDEGRLVRVTGPIRCTAVEPASIRVTVTQRSTATVAEGRWSGTCRQIRRTWAAKRVTVQGAGAFRGGRARVCALGVIGPSGAATDVKQWCSSVTLVTRR